MEILINGLGWLMLALFTLGMLAPQVVMFGWFGDKLGKNRKGVGRLVAILFCFAFITVGISETFFRSPEEIAVAEEQRIAEKNKQEEKRKVEAQKRETEKREQEEREKRVEAYGVAKEFVLERIKSPKSAKFPRYDAFEKQNWIDVRKKSTGIYIVKGYVDAQNVYGAMLRNHYVATVQHTGGKNWLLVELEFVD